MAYVMPNVAECITIARASYRDYITIIMGPNVLSVMMTVGKVAAMNALQALVRRMQPPSVHPAVTDTETIANVEAFLRDEILHYREADEL